MNFVMNHALQDYTWLVPTWVNDMNFGTKHAPDAGLIIQPFDLQSNPLPLCYGCPPPIPLHPVLKEARYDTDPKMAIAFNPYQFLPCSVSCLFFPSSVEILH